MYCLVNNIGFCITPVIHEDGGKRELVKEIPRAVCFLGKLVDVSGENT